MATWTPGPWKWTIEAIEGRGWPGAWHAVEHEPLDFGMDGEEGIYLDNPVDARLIAQAPAMAELIRAVAQGDDHFLRGQAATRENRYRLRAFAETARAILGAIEEG